MYWHACIFVCVCCFLVQIPDDNSVDKPHAVFLCCLTLHILQELISLRDAESTLRSHLASSASSTSKIEDEMKQTIGALR